ncbi:class I SAM-dependent methyltransferase [Mucilaginibacter terrae]|uniref:Ubiquinone/menaquinone biosynthesis C-methylase UbiE n=1 Tax=Mucilaginibacter terrae TaxID=1955052 RepID=A0ABU3GP07_9SPHI|nr:methyltransferase domain-containing protein [Mucilaginibacter terrae]MDT3401523.1 ubiquinone/menaquinone biosynthesis C-methylase UbiE [Mucilaginibacter terrae]
MKTPVMNAYEVRNADYAVVHAESEVDFDQFIQVLNIQNGEKVIDVGGGYGSIFIRLLQRQPHINFEYDLLDGGMLQLRKGEERISALLAKHNNPSAIRYLHQDATQLNLNGNYYDLVICKMFLHEIPESCKKALIDSLFAIAKPGGRLVIWNPDLEDNDYKFYTSVIRKKDELAGYESLVQNRHFLLNRDLYNLMESAGFTAVQKLLTFDYHLHTVNRLNEEFAGDKEKLQAWNDYILQIAEELDVTTRQSLKIIKQDDNIYINFKRGVFSLQKPQV